VWLIIILVYQPQSW